MPRITAATVAEHRAAQERALLDAAHELLQETSEGPTMADVAERAGLSRPSVDQYFDSRQDLFQALVSDIFPRWTESHPPWPPPRQSRSRPGLRHGQREPRGRRSSRRWGGVGRAGPGRRTRLASHPDAPPAPGTLIKTLTELGVADPELLAEMINSVVHAGTRMLEPGQSLDRVHSHLRTLLGPFVTEHQTPEGATGN
ncbi:helix-turn-helix domain-containing protein [Arthrobacter sp. AL12]|uniref:TetR/AcrR family transcriptional regulator n=1 Tax=Arthrobacter sp. AL12 TaxID=3042241 RepID=UPI002499E9A0|nr:helix-turn-helix domain-containing protein [Arthrobacter sp. AL12]MDI3213862.1 helix-turn-helix domain-containing protein [Arthrobacter sp. AL12]